MTRRTLFKALAGGTAAVLIGIKCPKLAEAVMDTVSEPITATETVSHGGIAYGSLGQIGREGIREVFYIRAESWPDPWTPIEGVL